MGFRIFFHSVSLVFGQLSGAFRVSGALYLMSLVLSAIGFYFLPPGVFGQQPTIPWQLMVAGVLATLLYLWIAVAWHRFVLLDEVPNGAVPTFHQDRLLAYLGRGLQAGAVLLGAGIALFIISLILLMIGGPSPIAVLVIGFIALTIFLLISYRLAPMLPAAAIGRPVGVAAAWTATSGASGTILVLAAISAIASLIIDLPINLLKLMPAGVWLVFAWVGIMGWVKLMVGVSILTTLYGVYIEKRTIA